MYDYLIVGGGLFGATFAYLAKKANKSVLIVEKKPVLGGGIRSERRDNIDIHLYGPHIFHTSDKEVWDFVCSLVKMNNFINEPLAEYKGKRYHLPFNMNTFVDMWGINNPEEAKAKIEKQVKEANIKEITNLEEQALSMIGKDLYETLIKGYTEKQWGKACNELPPEIIKRLPVRFTFDNNYFNDIYQGIPLEGYTDLIDKLTAGADVLINTNYFDKKNELDKKAKHIIYTGEIDRYYDYIYGHLEYRTLRFEIKKIDKPSYQGHAVINYTEREVPYTRIAEHKYFNYRESPVTYITYEYPKLYEEGDDPYYPVNNKKNKALYNQYKDLADKESNVSFAGRLGSYQYFDMDDTIRAAMNLFEKLKNKNC